MRVTIYGDRIDLADELRDEFIPIAKQAAKDAGMMLTNEVKRLLMLRQGDKSTSAPEGEPPERDEGDLLSAVKPLPVRMYARGATSGVKINHPGAARLEWGKTDVRGVRTFAHPYLRAALANVEDPINAMLLRVFGGETTVRNDRDVVRR
jgi:hypothetical protein